MSQKNRITKFDNIFTKAIIGLIVVLVTMLVILSVITLVVTIWYFTGFLVGAVLVYFGVPPVILELDTGVLFGIAFVIIRLLKFTKT